MPIKERMTKTYHIIFQGTEKEEKEFEEFLNKRKLSTTTGRVIIKWLKYLGLKGEVFIWKIK